MTQKQTAALEFREHQPMRMMIVRVMQVKGNYTFYKYKGMSSVASVEEHGRRI